MFKIALIAAALVVAVIHADSPHAEMERAKQRWVKHNKDSLIPVTEDLLHTEGIYARGVLPEAAYKGSTRAKKLWVRPFVNEISVMTEDGEEDQFVCCSELGPVRYHLRGFEVNTSGPYTISSVQDANGGPLLPWDGVIFLYEHTFAPADPITNLIAASDDYQDDEKFLGMSLIETVELQAHTRYILVTTGYAQKDRGTFINRIGPVGHDGQVDFDQTSCDEVGCKYIESQDCACDSICLEFDDCCFDYCSVCMDLPAPEGSEMCASVSGDPHVHGAFGEVYDVRGEADEVFNVLSDHNVQLNTRYISGCRSHSTVLGEIGLLFNEQELFFSPEDATLGGEKLTTGHRHFLGEGEARKSSWVEMQPDESMMVVTPDYSMRFVRTLSKKCDIKHVDIQLQFRNRDARPHGLLGQTLRESSVAKRDVHGRIDQGQEVLEGEWHHYKIAQKDLFGTEFRFNRYGNAAAAPATRTQPKQRPADMTADQL